MKKIVIISLVILALFVMTAVVQAGIGIGLCCGFRFDMGELHKGQSYRLGQMCILNTGDEPSCYRMGVTYHYQQPEKQIPAEWIYFEPGTFCLKPYKIDDSYDWSQQQVVGVYLEIPKNARKGDYFAYLEACTDSGGTVGVCVASKLSFTIVPGRANGK